jgi:hypothetical protein
VLAGGFSCVACSGLLLSIQQTMQENVLSEEKVRAVMGGNDVVVCHCHIGYSSWSCPLSHL